MSNGKPKKTRGGPSKRRGRVLREVTTSPGKETQYSMETMMDCGCNAYMRFIPPRLKAQILLELISQPAVVSVVATKFRVRSEDILSWLRKLEPKLAKYF
jgi:hypothetical protein